MSRSSMRVEAEIQLLNEILAEREAEIDRHGTDAEAGPLECPAPQVLWTLFEPAAEETAWTLRMRMHVNKCPVCGPLMENLRGFAAAADGSSAVSKEGKAAWAAADKRLERNIRSLLTAKRKPEPFWKLSWLPPMRMAYAMGGCAAMLLAAAGLVVYYGAGNEDARSGRSPQEEAAIWTKPGAQTADSTKPAESAGTMPANSPDGEHLPEPAATGIAAGEPAAAPQLPVAASTGAADDGTIASGAGAGGGSKIAASSQAVKTAADGPAVLLTAGTKARVEVLLVRQQAGGEEIEGNLAPLSISGAPAVIFSAYLVEGSGPVRLRIHMLEFEGKRLEVQGGDLANVTVNWPAEWRKPAPGQTVVVGILNGTMVKSAGEKK
jgi:hypothetical protein